MNKSELDNLFRDKLAHHEMQPRPAAWDKLSGSLEGNRKKGLLIYWRVAAILILMIGSVFLVIQLKNNRQALVAGSVEQNTDLPKLATEEESFTKEIAATTPKQMEVKAEETPQEIASTSDVAQNVVTSSEVAKQNATKAINKHNTKSSNDNLATGIKEKVEPQKALLAVTTATAKAIKEDENTIAATSKTDEMTDIASVDETKEQASMDLTTVTEKMADAATSMNETVAVALQDETSKNITITFKKDNSEMQMDEKKISKNKKFGLKKMIGLAKEIKNAELGISSLRAKKDQLLAKNFSKKKNVKISK